LNKMVVERGVKQAQAKAKGGRMVSASKSDGVSVLTGTQTSTAMHHIFSNLKTVPNAHALNTAKAAAACLEELHRLEVKCATNNNISQRAVTDRACPEWRNMIEYAIVNGALLSKQFTVKERHMGRHKFSGIRVSEFEYLLGAIYCHVVESRDFYEKYVGKRVPFIVIGHDNWDSDNKEILGVTVHWYNPVRKCHVCNPIGMCVVYDKSAAATVQQTLKLLAGCGIEKEDLYKAVNDTTNTAVRTGELLTGEKGTCAMHSTQLVIQHATGHLKRKKDCKIVDEFPECEDLRKKARDSAFYLMNKKAKTRFAKYKKQMNNQGRIANRIFMPNDTRAAGVHMFFNSMITSRWNLDSYWYEDPAARKYELDNDEYATIAELEAVLYPIALLTKLLQSDKFGSNSVSFLYTCRCFETYACERTWYVADVDKTSNIKKTDWWHAGAKFPNRDYRGHPLEWSEDQPRDSGLEKVYMVRKDRDELKEIPRKLIERITSEFLKYTADPTKNQLLAMACNPLTATIGMRELIARNFQIKQNAINPEIRQLARNYKQSVQAALLHEIKKVCSEMISKGNTPNDEETPITEVTEPRAADSKTQMSNWYKQVEAMEARNQSRETRNTPVEVEIQNFFTHVVNWYQHLGIQLENEKCKQEVLDAIGKNNSNIIEKWETIANHFDIMRWWEDFGKIEYPHIYVIACLVLPLPDSNASQERTFSSATWMDGKLNKRQSDATFQMKILLQQNTEFLEQSRVHVQEDYKKKMAEATRQLVESSVLNRTEEYEKFSLTMHAAIETERREVEQRVKEGVSLVEEDVPDDNDMIVEGFRDTDLHDDLDYDEEALEEFYEFESQSLD
jgi:hypothetical protein